MVFGGGRAEVRLFCSLKEGFFCEELTVDGGKREISIAVFLVDYVFACPSCYILLIYHCISLGYAGWRQSRWAVAEGEWLALSAFIYRFDAQKCMLVSFLCYGDSGEIKKYPALASEEFPRPAVYR